MKQDPSFYLDMIESMDIGVLVTGANGEYLYVNQAYCEMTQNTWEFFADKSIPMLKQMGYLSNSVWEKVVQTLRPFSSVITINRNLLGVTFDALTTGVPHLDSNGTLQYVVCTQETLEHLNARLQMGMPNRGVVFTDLAFQSNAQAQPVDIIAESPQMRELMDMVGVVARTDASVLVSGPSGSGKEVVARHIHRASKQSGGPFVALNCGAIPENLIESELFGYEKGAFTGASAHGKAGLLESANGGTLFLDEINSMPLPLQTKLLRALETKQATRIGSVSSREYDFRLICASNENLQELVKDKKFRPDLFYRINVVSLHIPPLAERKEDIVPLALHFLQQFCTKYACVKALSDQALNWMLEYNWPGNIRELRNFIERMVITSQDTEIQIDALPHASLAGNGRPMDVKNRESFPACNAPPSPTWGDNFSFRAYMDGCEGFLLRQAMKQFHTPAAAAAALKLDLSNVYRKLQKHQIPSRAPDLP